MRKVVVILLFILIAFYFGFKNSIDNFIQKNIISNLIKYEGNDYYLENNYNYFKINNSLIAYDKEDLLNIIYTFINKGTEKFSFFCSNDYFGCETDINDLMEDKSDIVYINDFIHPYNSFANINASIKNKKITVTTTKIYSYSDIQNLNAIIKEIVDENIDNTMDIKEKIKVLHNYMILNIDYDEIYADNIKNGIKNTNESNKATEALIKKHAVCSGYSDALSILLNYLNIKNRKISNNIHVWNYVLIDDTWYHIDVTNDDFGNEISYRFFLVNTDTIKFDKNHNFLTNVYS